MRKKALSTALFIELAALCAASSTAAAPTLRLEVDQTGDFLMVGNTFGWDCGPGVPAPIVGTTPGGGACGNNLADTAPDVFWRSDDDNMTADAATTVTPKAARTTAMLNVPSGAAVTHAYLYWAGTSIGKGFDFDDQVVFDRPDGNGGTDFSTSVVADTDDCVAISALGTRWYQCVAEVTSIVDANGSGAYRITDMDHTNVVNRDDFVTFGGWTLVVLYEDPDSDPRNLVIFDGLDLVDGTNAVAASLDGFEVPQAGFTGRLGVLSYEGDDQHDNDSLFFGVAPLDSSDRLSNLNNPVNNFFNGTRTGADGMPVSVAGDFPQLTGGPRSNAGWELDIVDITDRLSPGQTSADVEADTNGDVYLIGAWVTSISTLKPDFNSSTKVAEDLDGAPTLAGDEIEYTINVVNNGNDTSVNTVLVDPLPNGVTYKPGSLQIVSGFGAGALTDASGDDQGEYDDVNNEIVVRIGTDADETTGGTMLVNDTTVVSFIVTIDGGMVGSIENQAIITAEGELGAPSEDTPTDGNGRESGKPPTVIDVVECPPGETCIDTDEDGIYDDDEEDAGTDPNDADSDDDGVIDGDEPDWDQDSDGDGLINALDPDSDNDALFDGTELGLDCDLLDTNVSAGACTPDGDEGETTTDPLDKDTDDGGVTDGSEDWNLNGVVDEGETDPTSGNGADDSTVTDTDGDGLSDDLEDTLGTDPLDKDTDDDGLLDGDEPNPSHDTDGDGKINPLDIDSDGDGLLDGTEAGSDCSDPDTDPTNCTPDADPTTTTFVLDPDTDNGGVPDGVEDVNKDGAVDEGELDPNDPSDDKLCDTDTDCEGANSGFVCHDDIKLCVPGCRGIGDDAGCPTEDLECTSMDATIGQCVPEGGMGGNGAGGNGQGANGTGANGADPFAGLIVEGGACNCTTAGTPGQKRGLFAVLLGLAGLVFGRRRRRS